MAYIYLRETKTVIPPRDEDDDGKCLPPVIVKARYSVFHM